MGPAQVTAAHGGTWKLGDLVVNRIGFGSMRLAQTGRALMADAVPRDRDTAIAVLRRAIELGVNHIDTAAFYFSPLRSANELINSALAPYPDDLVIATKVGPGRDPSGQWVPAARPDQLRGQVEENLRQLGREHLDLVNLRVMSSMTSIADHIGALAELCKAGLIRHLGVSGVNPQMLAEARAVAPVVCVQNRYGIGEARAEHAFADACGQQGIAFVPYFTIAGDGRGAGVTGTENVDVVAVARAHGATAAQVRLAWALQRGPHVLVIPGTGNPDHLAANLAAGVLRLTPDEMTRLTAVRSAKNER
ncbi:MAG TPA: oxidoreductase [Streptosporangiaceae bacterium]|nr:oxidoreductase [Streptosporangiaceae bacterium]